MQPPFACLLVTFIIWHSSATAVLTCLFENVKAQASKARRGKQSATEFGKFCDADACLRLNE
jgi:hypothetical protein